MIETIQTVGCIAMPTAIVLYLLEFILLMQSSKFANKNYRVGKICYETAKLIYPLTRVVFWVGLIGISINITKAII